MWTGCDLSEGEMKKERTRERETGRSGSGRQLEEHNQKNTGTLGSASLGCIHVCNLMWSLIGELKVRLFWNVKASEQVREYSQSSGCQCSLCPIYFPFRKNCYQSINELLTSSSLRVKGTTDLTLFAIAVFRAVAATFSPARSALAG